MRLNEVDLRQVLARAEAIQHSSGVNVSAAEMESFLQAAEEVGYARTAVEQALREHLEPVVKAPAPGELVFARSTDGKFYVAEVVSSGAHDIHVRFLRGGEHTLALDDLRPCTFLPGQRVVCQWPGWGPWTCTVERYDASTKRIKASDGWGGAREFPISEVWLNPVHKPDAGGRRARVSIALLAAGTGIGALIGSVITAFVLR